ncbi:type III pantothenate kinase [Bacteroidia bacterium]|nr:type III pantothenate kinase [Bacteroidia bacterium]
MNITIDIGNSSSKITLFADNVVVNHFQFKQLTEKDLSAILDTAKPQSGIFCSVKKVEPWLVSTLADKLTGYYELTTQLALPLTIDYQTPQTLGMDRLAAAVGAWAQKPNTNWLIIDIGTAITIDFVTATGIYKGGNISPGPDLRFKALHNYTDRLPLVTAEGELPEFGYDTETAIRAGVIGGIVRELDAYIDEQQKKVAVSTLITGGYASYFENKLRNRTFADENLVPKGLNAILNFQK